MPIWLLRHGQSAANVAGVVSDDPAHPWGLTPLGITQARTAARALAKLKFVAVYVSEHRRTRQTAEVLLASWQLSGGYERMPALHTDARLNERHSNMDGRPVEDFDGLVRPDPVHIRPPGGETFLELVRRVRGFLEEVTLLHGRGHVLAVSHENPIQAAQVADGVDAEVAVRSPVANCAFLRLDWTPGLPPDLPCPPQERPV